MFYSPYPSTCQFLSLTSVIAELNCPYIDVVMVVREIHINDGKAFFECPFTVPAQSVMLPSVRICQREFGQCFIAYQLNVRYRFRTRITSRLMVVPETHEFLKV